ncbi:unnamed protein product [Arabidopsis thaliana]|uniref:Uncharacterized protein n=2 Tax=Arabidopsis TaxID=3701 RepID=A0A654F8M1_ARATH|nr:hypothetical protein ISN45_At03g015300 [Arabidopsis thaliana x Arabidopsis arenosa]VYS57418.1 unnamed protein product [Arabidopsis thaliana]
MQDITSMQNEIRAVKSEKWLLLTKIDSFRRPYPLQPQVGNAFSFHFTFSALTHSLSLISISHTERTTICLSF